MKNNILRQDISIIFELFCGKYFPFSGDKSTRQYLTHNVATVCKR